MVGGRRSLESVKDLSIENTPEHEETLQALKREYAITAEEEAQILKSLDN